MSTVVATLLPALSTDQTRARDAHAALATRIAETGPAEIEDLEVELAALSRAGVRAIAKLASAGETRAAEVLSRAGVWTYTLLDEPPPAGAEPRAWAMRAAAHAIVTLREQVAERLESLLADTSQPTTSSPKLSLSEGARAPSRICDQAFLALRRLRLISKDPSEQGRLDAGFLDLPLDARDRVIAATLARGFRNVRPDVDPGS